MNIFGKTTADITTEPSANVAEGLGSKDREKYNLAKKLALFFLNCDDGLDTASRNSYGAWEKEHNELITDLYNTLVDVKTV